MESLEDRLLLAGNTPPTVVGVQTLASRSAITAVVVSFSEQLDPATAMNASNFQLNSAGRDKRFGTADDRPILLRATNPLTYDAGSLSVTITPTTTLPTNQFFQITLNGTGVTDVDGNQLDGNGDDNPGGDYMASVARGTSLSYTDRNGDTVKLKLKGGGAMELVRATDGEGRDLQLVGTVAGRSVLTGSVKRTTRPPAGDGVTGLRSVNGLGTNRLGGVFLIDALPPAVTVTNPSDGFGATGDFTLTGQVADAGVGVASLRRQFDSGLFAAVAVGAGGDFNVRVSLPLDGSADGSHTIRLRATDRLGNLSDFVLFNFTLSSESPELTARLANDTGASAGDGLTFDPTITGSALHLAGGAEFRAGFDSTPVANFTDVLGDRQADGSFTLSAARLAAINGGAIDGAHTLHLRATDSRGDVVIADVNFTLDTTIGATSAGLSIGSDTGTVGDGQTSAANVTLVGDAEPGAAVMLGASGPTTTASTAGVFQFSNVALASGLNDLAIHVMDRAGNATDFDLALTRVAGGAAGDMVLAWNLNALLAIQADGSDPLIASRTLAMASAAVYDAVNAVEGVSGLYVSVPAPAGASIEAAVAAAAARVLSAAYPTQAGAITAKLADSLSTIPAGQSRDDGVAVGQMVADAIVALRANDGYQGFVAYIPGIGPGKWQLTAPMFMPAVGAHWPDVTPFVIDDPADFLPSGPPALASAQWATEFNQVKDIGAADSATRTADQTQIARFWSDGQGTFTPPGHWNEIAQQVATAAGNSISANARMFTILNTTMVDAGIVAWDAKFKYEFWRPITAIHAADTDGNAATEPDPDWQPLLGTPAFPEYVSGHSTFSGAAAEVLASIFGENVSFASTSVGLPNVTRNYTSFGQAAEEAGLSRIYGGIHFLAADLDGLAAGHAVADAVLDAFAGQDTQPPRILVDDYSAVASQNITLTGHVIDTVSGVATLTAMLDSAAAVNVAFDANTGAFSFPLNLATNGSADGVHHVVLVASDAAGNSAAPLDLPFTLDTAAPILSIGSPADGGAISAGLRLAGIANGTGSTIAALNYAFDGGAAMPVGFDLQTGAFDQPLDVGKLAVGPHVLRVTATDAAGKTAATDLNLTLGSALPLTIVQMLPLDDASEIGVTFHPKFTFSRPVDPATLTTANIRASGGGPGSFASCCRFRARVTAR